MTQPAPLDHQRSITEMEHASAQHLMALKEYQTLCMIGHWPAAEQARLRCLAWMEAGLDAFATACRWELGGG